MDRLAQTAHKQMLSVYLVHVNVTGQARVAEAMSLPTFAAGVPRGAVV